MAIAFGSAATSSTSSSNTLSWNQTIGSGYQNLLLVVGVVTYGDSDTPSCSSVSYNSVAMTKARSDYKANGDDEVETSIWVLPHPATGTHPFSASFSNNHSARAVSCYYTGCQQLTIPDSVGGKTGTGTGTENISLTTQSNNCWLFAVGLAESNWIVGLDTGSGATSRGNGSVDGILGEMRAEDSNGPKTPAGSYSIGFDISGFLMSVWAMSAISIAPFIPVLRGASVGDYMIV